MSVSRWIESWLFPEHQRHLTWATTTRDAAQEEVVDLRTRLEISEAKRIAAETLAVERGKQLEKVTESEGKMRAGLEDVGQKLDVLIQRVTAQSPTLEDLRKSGQIPMPSAMKAAIQTVAHSIRQRERALDGVVLQKFHPSFSQKSKE